MRRDCRLMVLHCLMILLLACPALADVSQWIVKDGQARAQIIIAPDASRMTRLAAKELQEYIQKITGSTLPITAKPDEQIPIRILVGVSEHTRQLGVDDQGLKHDSFRIVAGEDWLALVGNDREFNLPQPWARSRDDRDRVQADMDQLTGQKWVSPMQHIYKGWHPELAVSEYDNRGSLNAVYEYLRSLGVRWYLPGEENEIVPKQASLPLPVIDQRVIPDFAVRQIHLYNRFWVCTRAEALWQLRLGLSAGLDEVGLASFTHGTVFVHGREETKTAHPEFFALWGKRAVGESPHYGKPCLSSEELFKQNVAFARFLLDHYNLPYVSVMPADGYSILCMCDLCKGKDTPARGSRGNLSDYVWDYVNRVAIELNQSHPDRKVICFAYGSYMLPPEKISQLSPNVVVGLCQWRSLLGDPKLWENTLALREAWRAKMSPDNNFLLWEYYLHARPNAYGWDHIPAVFPQLIAKDLRSLKGKSMGEYVETYREHREDGWQTLATNHLNIYVTARMYWNTQTDLDALLQEYYTLFYGPAAAQAKTFFEYSEANWTRMKSDVDAIDHMFTLLTQAKTAAPADSPSARRLTLIQDYLAPLKEKRKQLASGQSKTYVPRLNVPRAMASRGSDQDVTIDGKLNETFWSDAPKYALAANPAGEISPGNGSIFKIKWGNDALYLGIRCYDAQMDKLNITASKADDPALWMGDSVDILIETHDHAYYQLGINPAGVLADADRQSSVDLTWSSGATAAVRKYPDRWDIELRIPITSKAGNDKDILQGVDDVDVQGIAGTAPSSQLPWHFNVCRQRVREGSPIEGQAYSPTGQASFHVREKMAELYVADEK